MLPVKKFSDLAFLKIADIRIFYRVNLVNSHDNRLDNQWIHFYDFGVDIVYFRDVEGNEMVYDKI